VLHLLTGDAGDASSVLDAWGTVSQIGAAGLISFLLGCVISKKLFVPQWYATELEQRLVEERAAYVAEKAATKADTDARFAAITAERNAAQDALAEQNDFYRTDVVPLFTKGTAALVDATREAEHRRWSSGGAGNGS
jgi:hypothetical protein